ncbi:hypothetical protein QWJ41_20990, partial [Nocardioides sp. SOB44]
YRFRYTDEACSLVVISIGTFHIHVVMYCVPYTGSCLVPSFVDEQSKFLPTLVSLTYAKKLVGVRHQYPQAVWDLEIEKL